MSNFLKFYKNLSQPEFKKAESTHSPKWDKCVMQVKEGGGANNAEAVCTAMLGTEAFKSMDESSFTEKIKLYMHKLGLSGAGPVPNSLLAGQDLEGKTTEKSFNKSAEDLRNFSVWYYDNLGAKKCSVFPDYIDAEAFAVLVDQMGFKNVEIVKSGQQPAEKSLVDNIKNLQLKRQKSELNARTKTQSKSFKNFWAQNARN